MRSLSTLAILLLLTGGLAFGQAKKGAAKAVTGTTPKFKAIWEPVPFNKDIELRDISCVGPETCWVAGRKSTILFTSDGGKTWKVQLGGDPEATDDDLAEIHFLDQNHGWVLTERSRVMGTTDGNSWAELGKVPSTSKALQFISPAVGFVADNSDSQTQSHWNRTDNGGKSWTRGNPCSVETTVAGLARKLGCMIGVAQFVSPSVGFLAGAAPIDMGTSMAFFSKTVDGGATWNHSVIPDTKHKVDSIHFWSEKDGLAVLASGATHWTADGGATWTGSANPPSWRSFYASAGGKMLVGVHATGRNIGYSFNGGRSFTSRPASLPAEPTAVTFYDATHGYLIGRHGMVFRYRIVPIDYSVPGMFAAAAPPQ
ncbi:MAG: YCF48-related protein [Bryobacteraceae bacterium]|nr:YCF48-related protein [Bryobacteraceae bacterium]